jgi:hypothetical protein
MKKHRKAGISLLVGGVLLLFAACTPQAGPSASPTDTLNANIIYTQAVQTVQAGISSTEAARPTQTPSLAPEPTFTMSADVAAGLTATVEAANQPEAPAAEGETVVAPAETTPGQETTPVVIPTATQQPAAGQASADKCEWVDNKPKDHSKVHKNANFDVTFVVRNVGTSTWTKDYALRYFAGDRMGAPADVHVEREVKPGELYSFVFEMKAQDNTGSKDTLFVVQNADWSFMCAVNLPLEVIE